MKKIVLFVDALPYLRIGHMQMSSLLDFRQLQPRLGYSVNLHYEIFAGKSPDDVGFFGEWGLNRSRRNDTYGHFATGLDRLMHAAGLEFCRKAYRKYLLRINDMIPFDKRHMLVNHGTYYIRELSKNKEFLGDPYLFYLEEQDYSLSKHIATRLKQLSVNLHKLLETERDLFISLSLLDAMGHKLGPCSQGYNSVIDLLDKVLLKFLTTARRLNYKRIIVLSDHGMSPAKEHHSLMEMDKKYGRFFGSDIVYFLDSLYFRAWSLNPEGHRLLENMSADLSKYPGRIIDKSARERLGISGSSLGDLVFVLDDGHAFWPNYFGYSKMKGYHGYYPGAPNQNGFVGLVRQTANSEVLKSTYDSMSAFGLLNDYLKG